MSCTQVNATAILVPCELDELVRGQEAAFVDRFLPLVRSANVTLDLGCVERIDAAGIAALVALYSAAHDAGCDFTVTHANHHVAEILSLVGLDRILLCCRVPQARAAEMCFEAPAA